MPLSRRITSSGSPALAYPVTKGESWAWYKAHLESQPSAEAGRLPQVLRQPGLHSEFQESQGCIMKLSQKRGWGGPLLEPLATVTGREMRSWLCVAPEPWFCLMWPSQLFLNNYLF